MDLLASGMDSRMPNFGYDELWHALEESVKLQSHYAELINMHDEGERMTFKNAKEWLLRLRRMEELERTKV